MQSQQMDPEENRYEGYGPFSTDSPYHENRDHFASSLGEKLSSGSTKRYISKPWLRVIIGLISAVLLLLLSYSVFDEHDGGIKILLICVSILSINIISNLLIGWRRKQRRMRGLELRLVLAFISGIVLVIGSNFMIVSNNGVTGVLVVVVSILCINVVSYLTSYSKQKE